MFGRKACYANYRDSTNVPLLELIGLPNADNQMCSNNGSGELLGVYGFYLLVRPTFNRPVPTGYR